MNAPSEPNRLAPLRDDVELHAAERLPSGAPTWLLRDPKSETYIRLGLREVEMLSCWAHGTVAGIAAAASSRSTITCTAEAVQALASVLLHNGLLRADAATLFKLHAKRQQSTTTVSAVLSRLLFPRITLWAPQAFLDATSRLVAPLFARSFWIGLALLFAGSALLVARKPAEFFASFTVFLNPESSAAIAAILVAAKVCHELGHAYAARHFGVAVPRIGVSFMMLWPMPFTDTTAAYLLKERLSRIAIAAAGVAAEMILATAALALWLVLAPGTLRDAAGFTATSLVALSLAVNANPLMRFDGYFVASDLVGMENLQSRAFEAMKWVIRRVFADVALPFPEPGLTPARRIALVVYAAACAVYRVTLYTGIVYTLTHQLAPALALPLSSAVLACYLATPVAKEVMMLIKLARRTPWQRGPLRLGVAALGLVALFAVPLTTTVGAPAVLETGDAVDVFAPEPSVVGRLHVAEGASVAAGDVLATFVSPETASQMVRATTRAAGLDAQVSRLLTSADRLEGVPVLEREWQRARAEVQALQARSRKLTVTAPVSGRIATLDSGLAPGLWVRADRPLLRIVQATGARVRAYVEERDLGDVEVGAPVAVWLEGRPDTVLRGRVAALFRHQLRILDEPQLAAPAGGPIVVRAGEAGTVVPEQSLYKVDIALDAASPPLLARALKIRGHAVISTAPRHLAGRIWHRLVGLWRREIG